MFSSNIHQVLLPYHTLNSLMLRTLLPLITYCFWHSFSPSLPPLPVRIFFLLWKYEHDDQAGQMSWALPDSVFCPSASWSSFLSILSTPETSSLSTTSARHPCQLASWYLCHEEALMGVQKVGRSLKKHVFPIFWWLVRQWQQTVLASVCVVLGSFSGS